MIPRSSLHPLSSSQGDADHTTLRDQGRRGEVFAARDSIKKKEDMYLIDIDIDVDIDIQLCDRYYIYDTYQYIYIYMF